MALRNLMVDSSIEKDIGGVVAQSTGVVSWSTEKPRTYSSGIKVVAPGTNVDEGAQGIGKSHGPTISAGVNCTASVWVHYAVGDERLRLNMRFWNGTKAAFSGVNVAAPGSPGWHRISHSAVSPADATNLSFKVTTSTATPTQAITFYIDDAQIEQGALSEYENTSATPSPKLYEWNGTAEVELTPKYWDGAAESALTIEIV